MASVICLSNSEPLCIAGHDHNWGRIYKIPIAGHNNVCHEKCRRCRHCAWVHLFNYSGVGKYRKRILLDDNMEKSRPKTLCVTCKKKPSLGTLLANCQECEDKRLESGGRQLITICERKDFIKADIANLGGDISALERKYDIIMDYITTWLYCKEQDQLEHMLTLSTVIPNEYDRAEFIKHISDVKIGFRKLDAEMSAHKSKLRVKEKVA